MRTSIRLFLCTILALPCVARLQGCEAGHAQTYSELMQEVLQDKQGLYADVVAPQPILPVVPVVPIYPNAIPRNPYGTGYSIVTTERSQPDYIQRYLGIKDATTRTTTTSVVPNNAWGQPIRPINPFWP